MSRNPIEVLEEQGDRSSDGPAETETEAEPTTEQPTVDERVEIPQPEETPVTLGTQRTRGLELVAVIAVGVGLLTGSAVPFVLTVVLVGVIVYHRMTRLPPVELTVERAVSDVHVVPGDIVDIEVTVTNKSDTNLPDLRLADQVPERLAVVDGKSMGRFALGPGDSATLSYAVKARRGRHNFETVTAVCRNVSGSQRRQLSLRARKTIVSGVDLEEVPLASQAGQYAGRLETSMSGGGVEFYSTREFLPSDSASDIDWRRFARTGELATIEYKDTRAASIHLLVDDRSVTPARADPDDVTIREMALYAGEHVAQALMTERHEVGLTTLDSDEPTIYPNRTPEQYRRIRRQFERTVREPQTGTSLTASTADELVDRTPSHTQFVCVTGLVDDGFDSFLDRLVKHGRPILVISPRPDLPETPGARLAMTRRAMRIDTLRRQDARVLDWKTDEPLWLAIESKAGGLWQ